MNTGRNSGLGSLSFSTYTNCIQLYVVFAIHAIRLIDFQQIENHRTNGTIYDFFVQKTVLYQIQQGGICTFTNLRRKKEKKYKIKIVVHN